LGDSKGNAYTDQLLKTGDIGNEISIQVIAVESAPEGGVGCRAEKVVKYVEFLNSL
jgi:hypothetical protein